MHPDEPSIRNLHSTWIAAVNAANLPLLLTLMADDAIFLNPGQPPIGRDAFSPGFLAAHQQSKIICISNLQTIAIVDQVAYTTSHDTLSVTPRTGGKTIHLAGHRLTIYRQQPDHRWLLTRDAHTLTPVQK